MKISLRRVCNQPYDPELLWGLILVPCAIVLGAAASVLLGDRVYCTYRRLTGFRCPGCGATHAVRHLLHGRMTEAWNANPLLVCVLLAAAVFMTYSAAVVLLRLPRIRVELTAAERRILVLVSLLGILAYWRLWMLP